MKVKGGGKRKVVNPALNDAVEANDEIENQEHISYDSIDLIDVEHQENQEQGKDNEREKQKGKEKVEEEKNNEEEDEEEEEEEEGEEEDEDALPQEERPKLDEGFFEIEAIRRKRVRKVTLILIVFFFSLFFLGTKQSFQFFYFLFVVIF